MGRPVVAAQECCEALTAGPGTELISAADADAFVQAVDSLLRDPQRAAAVGAAGRNHVLRHYSWDAHLSSFDRHLEHLGPLPDVPGCVPGTAARPNLGCPA